MSRFSFIALALSLLLASASLAQVKADANEGKFSSSPLPIALYGEAKPSSSCSGCKLTQASATSSVPGMLYLDQPVAQESYGAYVRHQLKWDRHECSPDGCPKAVGCSNFWSELKFVFGSCRQFYGTAESTVYHHRNTRHRDYP